MAKLADEVKAIVQLKLTGVILTDLVWDEAVTEAGYVIMNEINHRHVPEPLKYTWANIAVDILLLDPDVIKQLEEAEGGDGEGEGSVGRIASIHEGDTTISFGSTATDSATVSGRVNSAAERAAQVVLNYERQLQPYRAMKWGRRWP